MSSNWDRRRSWCPAAAGSLPHSTSAGISRCCCGPAGRPVLRDTDVSRRAESRESHWCATARPARRRSAARDRRHPVPAFRATARQWACSAYRPWPCLLPRSTPRSSRARRPPHASTRIPFAETHVTSFKRNRVTRLTRDEMTVPETFQGGVEAESIGGRRAMPIHPPG